MAFENPTYGSYRDLPTTNMVLFDCETNDLNSEFVWCIHAFDMDEQKLYKFEPTIEEILNLTGVESEEDLRRTFYDTGFPDLNHTTCDFTEEFLAFFKDRADKVWVAHNALGFDAPELNRLILHPAGLSMNRVLDSLVISRLLRTQSPFSNMIPWFESKGIDTRQGGHSLEAWGKRLKCFKGDFKDFAGGFSLKMSDYCTQDVRTLFKIWKELCKEQKQYKFSYESIMTEHRAAKMLRQQQDNGFTLDRDQCIALRDETQKLLDHYIEELHKIFPPKRKDIRSFTPRVSKTTGRMHGTDANTLANNLHEKNKDGSYTLYEMVEFNPKSPQQIIERFMDLGWEPKEFTDKGNPKTGQDVMPKILEEVAKDYPEAMAMLRYTIVYDRNAKAKKWLELSERTGKMHGKVFHIGAWTHRCAHRDDNMANVASVQTKKVDLEDLPKGLNHFEKIQEGKYNGHLFKEGNEIILTGLEGAYGWESRNCWTVDDSIKFTMIGCDAAGIQLRALGHYLAEFDGGDYGREVVEGDIHTRNQHAAEIHDRPTAKTFIYAWLLGAGDPKIGNIVGVTSEEIQRYKKDKTLLKSKRKAFEYQNIVPTDMMLYEACKGMETKEKFLNNLPQLKQFREETIKQAAERGWMEGLDGRKIHIPSEHLAMGAYLQGFESVVMKHAMWLWQQECGKKGLYFKQLAFVHDEFQIQTLKDEAEEVGKIVAWSIGEAGRQLGSLCQLDGGYSVGSSWSKTH